MLLIQLHHLFEAESVSFLDEVERAGSLHLAQTVASEVSPNKRSFALKLIRSSLTATDSCWLTYLVMLYL